MYTPDQYQRAKAQLSQASPETPRYAEIKARVSEFERYNPDHSGIQEAGLHAQSGERLSEEPAQSKLPALPSESAGESAAQFSSTLAQPKTESSPVEADLSSIVQAPDPMAKREAARKLLEAPPEYVSQTHSRLGQKALGTLIDPLNGPAVGNYYEPSEHQFNADMGQVLKARGITPESGEYKEAFEEYKDRKWKLAYEQAKAEDKPLQRVERLKDSPGWQALGSYLAAQAPDVASAFAKGYAAGGTMHATTAFMGIAAPDAADADREQAERNPVASTAGEFFGSIRSGGPLAKLTNKVGGAVAKYLPGMSGRIVSSALGGAVAGESDLAARSLANAAGDVTQGRGTESAKDRFTSNLLSTGLIGGGLGALGGLVAEGANAYQKSVATKYPETTQLRRGGGDTSILTGVKPGDAVAENVEAARQPVFGEAKVPQGSTPTEVAAAKVQQPIAESNAKAHTDLRASIAAAREAAYAADPELSKPKPVRNTARAAVDWVLSKLQPEASKKFLPGMRPTAEKVAPAADAQTAAKLADQLWKPRLVTSVEAANEARQAGGRVISVEDAQRLGIDVGGLRQSPAFVPQAEQRVNVAETLPRYPKGQAAGEVAADITPEETAAIQRYTFGKRNPEDTALVNNYLERAPSTPLPHVYRGISMSPEAADDMMASGSFDTGSNPASVSSDPITARSFAARNRELGQVGITFKLEGASAKNIQTLAHEQVGVEKELLLPANKRFEITGKHPDPANPGDWIVVAKEVPSEPAAGSTTEEIFGRPADKITPSPVDRLQPREGRAARTPTPIPGSDWDSRGRDKARFDFVRNDLAVADPFPAQGNDNPTRVSNSPPISPPSPPISVGAPSSPPPELRAKPTQAASQAQAAGLPPTELKVVLEPREYDAKKLEEIIGDIDLQAKAGKANANPDPQWKLIQKAIREDRNQFGPKWSDMIAKHHEQLNELEQRSARAGLTEAKSYSEMQPNSQQAFDNKLEGFPGNQKSSNALRSIAADASPKVLQQLEELGATNAYDKLKDLAAPKLSESTGMGRAMTRIHGAGPAVRLRGDALARRLASGATGESTIPPGVLNYVRAKVPGRKWLPGNISLGGGALGLKGSAAYNKASESPQQGATLTPEQIDFLGKLLDAVNSKEATP